MISDAMKKCLKDIGEQQEKHKNRMASCVHWRAQEASDREAAERAEQEVEALEIAIDQLQLQLRRILNGEESLVQVELPKEASTEMLGRES